MSLRCLVLHEGGTVHTGRVAAGPNCVECSDMQDPVALLRLYSSHNSHHLRFIALAGLSILQLLAVLLSAG